MSMSFDTFERFQQKGLDARRAGQWDTAKHYLLKAAQALLELNKSVLDPELKQARRERAEKLFQLAKDCDAAKAENRRASPVQRGKAASRESASNEEGDKDASQWVVKEKPGL